MAFISDLALHVYQQIFFGVDRPLGYTLNRETGEGVPVEVPPGVRWYVRHNDDRISDQYLDVLLTDARERSVPGLSLASCRQLTNEGLERVAELRHLETLDLFNTNLSDEGLAAIADLPQLSSLNIAGTEVSDSGVAVLKQLPRLEQLHLGWTAVGDAGCSEISKLASLKILELRKTAVTNQGLESLGRMSSLHALGLQETAVTSDGLLHLEGLSSTLQRLDLGYTRVDSDAVAILKRMVSLRTLVLRATPIDRSHDAAIREALPQLGGVDSGPGGTQEGLIR